MSLLYRRSTRNILDTVHRTLQDYNMFRCGDTILAAVSGGPDSVALVSILRELAPGLEIRLGMAHLHHGLRGAEADRDAAFAEKLARQLDLPCHTAYRDVPAFQRLHRLSPEEAARRVRYDFLENTAEKHGYNRIALGHHGDDNAELLLMYLLRGSGPLGLSGIPAVRDEKFVRPLIRLTRSDIMEWLRACHLDYVTDASNSDLHYTRNRIRHDLIPRLRQDYNPQVVRTLNRLADIVREEEIWIADVVKPLLAACLASTEPGKAAIDVPVLNRMPVAAQRRVIRSAIGTVKGNLRRITWSHVEAVCELGKTDSGARAIHLPGQVRAVRDGSLIRLIREQMPLRSLPVPDTPGFEYCLAGPGEIRIPETSVRIRITLMPDKSRPDVCQSGQHIAFFDMEKISFPVVIRNFRPGDRFTPIGMSGTQKLKKYFINNKVPPEERNRCPVLLCGERIIWVAGHRMDDSVKILSSTRRILKAELLLA